MAFIDGSALTVALPKLRAAFGADLASVQWVLNGYVLALAALTLIGGALADVYGKARMLGLGCIGFGSGLDGLRGGADHRMADCVSPAAGRLGRHPDAGKPGADRRHAIPRRNATPPSAVWAAASALTTAGGPVLGGWLTEAFGWPYVFAINPPIALAAVGLAVGSCAAGCPRTAPLRPHRRGHSGRGARSHCLGAEPDRTWKIRRGRMTCRSSSSRPWASPRWRATRFGNVSARIR